MSLPSFLCIGAQKAATSWLYVTLQEHPEIWMPPIKELHFFDHLYVPENRNWTQGHLKQSARNLIKAHVSSAECVFLAYVKYLCETALDGVFTEAWYRRVFDRPNAKGKITGDITPEYCTIPREGVEYVRKLLGDLRLIYIIRDPMDRALSQIRMAAQRQYGQAALDLTDAQWREIATMTPVVNRGDYNAYIPTWLEIFEEDSFLFIPFRQIRENPRAVLDKVERHLGISHYDGYSAPHKPEHVTAKVPVPDCALESFVEELRVQQEFLRRFFGEDFIAMI
jgi:hypothetical protein